MALVAATTATTDADSVFGLWPGPPAKFGPTGKYTAYQYAAPVYWPMWGNAGDQEMGASGPPGHNGHCTQGTTYGSPNQLCGGGRGSWKDPAGGLVPGAVRAQERLKYAQR